MEPRKKIEFLANEVMGDLVQLMDRIEALPALISDAEGRLSTQADKAVQAALSAHADTVQQASIKTLEAVAEKATANIKVGGDVAAANIAKTSGAAQKIIGELVTRLEKATAVARWGVVEIFWYMLLASLISSAATIFLLKWFGMIK